MNSDNSIFSILMFAHNSFSNRGCEAIVRSSSRIISDTCKKVNITLTSDNVKRDYEANMPNIHKYIQNTNKINKYSIDWFKSIYFDKFKKDFISSAAIIQKNIIREVLKNDICISIGGDNYCYGRPVYLYAINREVKKRKKKLVLWGASIEPSSIDKEMMEDLKAFDLLTIRETITYNALLDLHILNAVLLPDPAFSMEPLSVNLPIDWYNGDMVGINISPLIIGLENKNNIVIDAFDYLIKRILLEGESKIVFIPHVFTPGNNDIDAMKNLYTKYKDTGRVLILNDGYNAPQLKYIISKCRFFIGARTHATIAAYSTNVPTLVLGYSVKSKGIAKDIFGDYKDLVLPVQDLVNEYALYSAYKSLIEREKEIKIHLYDFMPNYISMSKSAGKNLVGLLIK